MNNLSKFYAAFFRSSVGKRLTDASTLGHYWNSPERNVYLQNRMHMAMDAVMQFDSYFNLQGDSTDEGPYECHLFPSVEAVSVEQEIASRRKDLEGKPFATKEIALKAGIELARERLTLLGPSQGSLLIVVSNVDEEVEIIAEESL